MGERKHWNEIFVLHILVLLNEHRKAFDAYFIKFKNLLVANPSRNVFCTYSFQQINIAKDFSRIPFSARSKLPLNIS